ncbi:MAG: methionine synthase [Methanophagales archaeon]|nr:methionine synthase [Methanophagales archaeon]
MKRAIFDDIGSYPLPEGTTKEWLKEAFAKIEIEIEPTSYKNKLYETIKDAMWQKINAGVEVPNYPQFQNMISQFLEPIMDDERTEAPLLIREEEAKMVEMDALEEMAEEYMEKKGEKLKLRICVTGPIELYYNQFPPPVYIDVLSNLAKSVGRFIKHAIEEAKGNRNYEVKCASIDEPSMGLDPRIEEEGIITALELASEYAFRKGIDTQIHLHSPIFYDTVCQVEGISVIGLESAANPSLLTLIDKKQLDKYDKFLRIGVSRTDILSMAAEYDEIHHTNAFKDKGVLDTVVNEYNSPGKVKKRLEKAYSIFGERIKYVGPDCGLGPFPNQELAYLVLKNTSAGIKDFYNGPRSV